MALLCVLLLLSVLCLVDGLPCDSSPCQNDGTCNPTSGGAGYTCTCYLDSTGPTCQYPIPIPNYTVCKNGTPCKNGATCFPNPLGFPMKFFCFCQEGYSGLYCELDVRTCFPATATVLLQDGVVRNMCSLQLGDIVQTWDPTTGSLSWSPVRLFLDRASDLPVDLVEVLAEGAVNMSLSGRHLLPVLVNQELQWLWADQVQPGQRVRTTAGWVQVLSVRRHRGVGAFAPLTSTGTIMVDGMAASCFAGIKSHTLGYWATKPAVWLSHWLGDSVQEGVHWYARTLLQSGAHLLAASLSP